MKATLQKAALLMCICMATATLMARVPGGSVMGKVTDPDTKKPVADATVIFTCMGNEYVYYANEHGLYNAGNLPAGTYSITVRFMSNVATVNNVKVVDDNALQLDLGLSMGITLTGVAIDGGTATRKIIDPFNPEVQTLSKKEIEVMPITRVDEIAVTQAGVTEVDGQYYVKGAREGSLAYYIDGCKVMGSPNIPLCGLDLFRTYTGYIPAKYGDSVGGVVVMDTRNYFAR